MVFVFDAFKLKFSKAFKLKISKASKRIGCNKKFFDLLLPNPKSISFTFVLNTSPSAFTSDGKMQYQAYSFTLSLKKINNL